MVHQILSWCTTPHTIVHPISARNQKCSHDYADFAEFSSDLGRTVDKTAPNGVEMGKSQYLGIQRGCFAVRLEDYDLIRAI